MPDYCVTITTKLNVTTYMRAALRAALASGDEVQP